MRKIIKTGLIVGMCFYLLVLSKLILFKHLPLSEIISHFTFSYEGPFWNEHNFIPFKTIFYYLFLAENINFTIRVQNIVGNVIGFVPYGLLLPLISKRFQKITKVMLATLCLSLMFELLQLIFKFGSFDVDDMLLNTLGGVLGYLPIKLLKILSMKAKNREA
ncbi:VanZ family protein [Virgibacillus pantothenticus]|uniref:VanZ family protein n=1 Tax=Virgibacillus pantothenticus TaxID=1473 RepID=UPI0009870FF3|nr:VanZ family protein [Virgibacillus pantothenticus]